MPRLFFRETGKSSGWQALAVSHDHAIRHRMDGSTTFTCALNSDSSSNVIFTENRTRRKNPNKTLKKETPKDIVARMYLLILTLAIWTKHKASNTRQTS
jgi:hypothetical protein